MVLCTCASPMKKHWALRTPLLRYFAYFLQVLDCPLFLTPCAIYTFSLYFFFCLTLTFAPFLEKPGPFVLCFRDQYCAHPVCGGKGLFFPHSSFLSFHSFTLIFRLSIYSLFFLSFGYLCINSFPVSLPLTLL